MGNSNKKYFAVAAFSAVCFLSGTFAGNSVWVEKAQDACAIEHNLPKAFFKHSSGFVECPEIKKGVTFMALMAFGSGVSGLVMGAAIAGRKKKTPDNPAP